MKLNTEKRSKHKLNVYQWIIKVIDSCTTYKQAIKCQKLIDNYKIQYNLNYHDSLYTDLDCKLYYKKESLIE